VAFGSYSSGGSSLIGGAGDGEVVVVEHCLGFDFAGKGASDEIKRGRVRVQQTLGGGGEGAASIAVQSLSAWKEFYYEEFKNASSLCASCGGPNKWGESPNTDPDELTVGLYE
jgi:hypothetical protein